MSVTPSTVGVNRGAYTVEDYQRIDWTLDEAKKKAHVIAFVPIGSMSRIVYAIGQELDNHSITGCPDAEDPESARIEVIRPAPRGRRAPRTPSAK